MKDTGYSSGKTLTTWLAQAGESIVFRGAAQLAIRDDDDFLIQRFEEMPRGGETILHASGLYQITAVLNEPLWRCKTKLIQSGS